MYDDARGGALRKELYCRLKYLFQFRNEMKLFSQIGNAKNYEISIISARKRPEIEFLAIFDVLHPKTIDSSFDSTGDYPVPTRKTKENKWNLSGHPSRLIELNPKTLGLCNEVFAGGSGTALSTPLPSIYCKEMLRIFHKLKVFGRNLGNSGIQLYQTTMFGETDSSRSGIIESRNIFPERPDSVVISGPHYYVANPLFQQPRKGCKSHRDYEHIYLETIPDDFIARVKYTTTELAVRQIPEFKNKPITSYYRLFNRKRALASNERTLISCIIPPSFCHIISSFSTTFDDYCELLRFAGFSFSIVADFVIRSAFKADILGGSLASLPVLDEYSTEIGLRSLMLNCLTVYYSDLWSACWHESFRSDKWAKDDPRLDKAKFANLKPKWRREYGLRSEYGRRQALVEIDVLAAMGLGLKLQELRTIYRVQFSVLRQNEADTWYDQNGRIVFTISKGLSGVGFPRKSSKTEPIGWEDIKDMKSGTVERTIIDDTLPGGPVERTITYQAPFDRCNREKDYEVVWAEFERRFKEKEGNA